MPEEPEAGDVFSDLLHAVIPDVAEEDEVPDLRAIPRAMRVDALRPLDRHMRKRAVSRLANSGVPTEEWQEAAGVAALLELEDPRPRVRAARAPDGVAVRGPAPERRQVNFRLGELEHDRLREAARRVSLRPTQLARLLVVRGVELTLASREPSP